MNTTLDGIRMLAMDADGVLTDGGLYYGDKECFVRFDIKDGHGIRSLTDRGIPCAVISGRSNKALTLRCQELGIVEVHDGVQDKLALARKLIARIGLDFSQLAYIGDDLPDIPLLKQVGFAAAPADAVEAVREACHWVSRFPGGRGAVRELCELLQASSGTNNGQK